MNFTNYDIAILLGLLLGDGYIDPRGQIQIKHCEAQKEYCEYKAKLLHSVCGGKDIKLHVTQIYGNKKNFKKDKYNYYGIKKQSKHFKLIRDLLYPNNKKEFTQKVLSYLQPISIALWWMDDGCLSRRKLKDGSPGSYMLRLFTYTSKEETDLIKQFFLEKYNVNWNVVKADGSDTQYMLRCGVNEGRKFLNIIRSIVLKIPCMAYKVLDI